MTDETKPLLEVALKAITTQAGTLLGQDPSPRTLHRVQRLLVIAKALRRQIVSDTKVSGDEKAEITPYRDPMDNPVPPPPFEEDELIERDLGLEENEAYARPYRMRAIANPAFGPDLRREEDLAKIVRIEAARRRDEAETRVAMCQELMNLRILMEKDVELFSSLRGRHDDLVSQLGRGEEKKP